MMCFSEQEKQRCYKSRSPTLEYWWQFTQTRKSIFEHNFTAVAMSSYKTSGFCLTSNVVLISDSEHGDNYLLTMGSLKHAESELLKFSTWEWSESLPYWNYTEVYSFAAFFYHKEFYIVGGRTKNEILSVVTSFDPITKKWTQIGDLKSARYGHTVEVFNDKLYVIGGLKTFEYCDLLNGFGCSLVTDTRFEQKDYPILYKFYPSQCELGNSN